MASTKLRLDQLVVRAGLAPSGERARALIAAGKVTVNGQIASKAGTQVSEQALVALRGEDLPFVSRGGLKLDGALESFGIDVAGLCALDVGQSTGGFTDCLLQRGARHVIGVDVGYGQLAWKLRQDPRVTCVERVNARAIRAEQLAAVAPPSCWPPELAVIDVSFISLRIVLPAVAAILGPTQPIIALIKPQFEASRERVGKGGVVREEQTRLDIIDKVLDWARAAAYTVEAGLDSSVAGPKGNVEYLALLKTPANIAPSSLAVTDE